MHRRWQHSYVEQLSAVESVLGCKVATPRYELLLSWLTKMTRVRRREEAGGRSSTVCRLLDVSGMIQEERKAARAEREAAAAGA